MTTRVLIAICLAPLLLAAAWAEEKQTIRKTLPAARTLDVDNVFGSIRVTGYVGNEIQIVAHESIRADTAEKLELARKEVQLKIFTEGETAKVYVDGPFRCHAKEGGHCADSRSDAGYRVNYDFEIQVPRSTALALRTVNAGQIRVESVNGNFEIHNVNGGIEMAGISGAGNIKTVNGPVKVDFAANPSGPTSVKTINGELDLVFRPGLAADFKLQTFNGHIYSDFDMQALPQPAGQGERKNGKFIYRGGRVTGARVGQGGPEIQVDGFNGDIRIHKGS